MTHPFEGIEGFDKFLKKAEKIVADHRTEYHGEYYMKGGVVGSVASVALPIIGSIIAPGIGTALGSTLASSTLAGIGGAVGGATGGAIGGGGVKGALKGAALGGVGGYLSGGGASELLGGTQLGNTLGLSVPQGGSVVGNAIGGTSSGTNLLGNAVYLPADLSFASKAGFSLPTSSILSGITSSSSLTPLILGGNLVSGILGADAAKRAGQLQYKATQDAINRQTELARPYVDAGNAALGNYTNLLSSPEAQLNFVQNNPFYSSLADEAQRRLTQSQATKGKLGSGGTASALQDQLLQLGNGLVQQNLGNQQNLINTGYSAASNLGTNTANLLTSGAAAKAAGNVGAVNAGTGAYNNGINSLLALQLLNKYKGA